MSLTDADAHSNLAALLSEPPLITSSSASTFDNLTCLWAHCGERAASPEHLYEHVCERHVGRKSTNNLNLQCQWGSCRTTTVKRDHITSHIRVHVPLKPHRCELCGKSFKRPQDLKKHVKTHADGSVLLRSPESTVSNEPSGNNRYPISTPKPYHGDQPIYPNDNYNNHSVAPSNNAFHSTASHAPNFGPVYYSAPQPGYVDAGITESRKRSYSVLNDFFGDAKRRHIDPHQYHDLSDRFGGMPNLPLPAHVSFGNDFNSSSSTDPGLGRHDTTSTMMAASHVPVPAIHLDNPFTELKTKNDLMSLDTFLETLQNTVYEHTGNPNNVGALPVSQMHHTNLDCQTNYSSSDRRSSANPLGFDVIGAHPPSSSGSLAPPSLDDTPALTPDSHNGYSPASACSLSASPYSTGLRQGRGNLYPTLPSFSAMTGIELGYAYPTGGSASYLGNSYDDFTGRRCYLGSILQRAAPASPPRVRSDRSSRPTSTSRRSSAEREALLKGVQNVELASPTSEVEPPAGRERDEAGEASGFPSSSSAEGRQQGWIQNIRVIEALRSFIKERLHRGEYQASEDECDAEGGQRDSSARSPRQHESEETMARGSWNTDPAGVIELLDSEQEREKQRRTGSLYPILRAVEAVS